MCAKTAPFGSDIHSSISVVNVCVHVSFNMCHVALFTLMIQSLICIWIRSACNYVTLLSAILLSQNRR